MPLKPFLSRFGNALLDMVFPPRCPVCRSFFHPPETARQPAAPILSSAGFSRLMAAHLCAECAAQYTPVTAPVCPVCGLMQTIRTGGGFHLCQSCAGTPHHFSKARAAGVYDQSLRETIHLFKYQNRLQFARPLGRLLFAAFLQHWPVDGIDLIAPVPLHISRFRKRGFNQAWLILREWPRLLQARGLQFSPETLARDALIRSRKTRPQVGMHREKRRHNIRNAFSVPSPDRIADKRILLVDDVFTTGATADECARILLDAGAVRVDVLTLAQTGRNR